MEVQFSSVEIQTDAMKRTQLESQDELRTRNVKPVYNGRNRAAAVQEAVQMQEWLSKEDDFVLQQAKKRAAIRVRENRARPIDFLAVNLSFVDPTRKSTDDDELDGVAIVPKDPVAYLRTLLPQEVTALLEDVVEFEGLESNASNRAYWNSLGVVCRSLMKNARHVPDSTVDDVDRILQNKDATKLEGLAKTIAKKLEARSGIDVNYWEYLQTAVTVKQAEARLSSMFDIIRSAAEKVNASIPQQVIKPATVTTQVNEKDFESATMKLYKQEAKQDLEHDEELFNTEVDIPATPPKWADQHPDITPQKPKFFNRVQVGYEWNAYNKIHYTEQNPPPKIVTGYRFNLFYPDLLDPTKAPSYKVEQKGRTMVQAGIEQASCILRFFAGPPYADVCFEVIDKDWDHSSRYDRGYKSSFDKGILQLHFKFKRITYRE